MSNEIAAILNEFKKSLDTSYGINWPTTTRRYYGLFYHNGHRIFIRRKGEWREPGHAKLAFRNAYNYTIYRLLNNMFLKPLPDIDEFWKAFWQSGIVEIKEV